MYSDICNRSNLTYLGVGKKGEGTALYVNGILTPDIYLERGNRYTFLIETGAGDLGNYEDFHPVYITSDSSGGHQLKPDLEAKVYSHTIRHKNWKQ